MHPVYGGGIGLLLQPACRIVLEQSDGALATTAQLQDLVLMQSNPLRAGLRFVVVCAGMRTTEYPAL